METYPDEIDLREYIEVLWRWRTLVLTITLLATTTAGIISFFVLKPVYEASAQIMAPQTPLPAEIIKSPNFMQAIVQELGLQEQYNAFDLARAVSLETSRASATLTTIKVQNEDAALATKIANQIAADFLEFLREKNSESTSASIAQLTAEKTEATASLNSIRYTIASLKQTTGMDALQTEVSRLANLVATYSSQQMESEMEEQGLLAGIVELSKTLAATPMTLSGPPDWSGHPTEIPNETYQRLNESLALAKVDLIKVQTRLGQIARTLPSLKADYEGSYARLLGFQRQLEELEAQDKILAERITSFTDRISELTTSLPETNVVSPALEPVVPIKPRKLVNMAVATVLGGFLSILAVFAIEYWRSPRKAVAVGQ